MSVRPPFETGKCIPLMNQFSTGGVFGNTAKRLTASELAQALNDQLDDVPGRLGLTEIHFSPDEIRCGPNGHISIVRRAGQGKQRGWWMDFKADADGTDMLDFSAHILGSSISDTMRWAASSFTLVPAARYEHPVPQDENAAQK